MPLAASVRNEDVQELRLALVMNGGVSLAIWMGGVTKEIDRVRRAHGAYGELAHLLGVEPRVDVIAGASAGGINGALLALAMARGTDTDEVRQLWLRHGSVAALLRDPLAKEPPSIFQGDEYFLPRLREAMSELAGHPGAAGVGHPLHLTITGTALTGEVKGYTDHFGVPIPDTDHRVRFEFRRGAVGKPRRSAGEPVDDFDRGAGPRDLAVERLSLAARSTASFPAAFEPSWCPVDPNDAVAFVDELRPNMGPVAPALSASRWLIDGGVLVNTPFRAALDAVATLAAHRQVRRVLAYVVPNLGEVAPVPADDRDKLPGPLEVAVDSLSNLPRVQSIGRELEEIEANNVRVQRRRSSRRFLLDDLRPEELERVAASLYGSYVRFRRQTAADDIVQLALDATYPSRQPSGDEGPAFRDPAMLARLKTELAKIDPPWLPPREQEWSQIEPDTWQWGLAPVENLANVTLDVLSRGVRHARLAESREAVTGLRAQCHELLAALQSLKSGSDEFWRANAGAMIAAAELEEPGAELRSIVQRWDLGPTLGVVAFRFASLLVSIADLLDAPPESELRQLLETLVPRDSTSDDRPGRTLRRLLALDVVQRASGADLAGIEQEIELVLMSADAANSFDARFDAEAKLAGMQVHHFGSFYKSSWRANDWMWGRLDGADRLVRTLVDPPRIFQLLREGRTTQVELIDGIHAIACGGAFSAWLTARWTAEGDAERVTEEIAAIPAEEPPPAATTLPACYAAIRRRIQLEILADELPELRKAVVELDRKDETAQDTRGTRWADEFDPAPTEAAQLVSAFKACSIGKEQLKDEIGSDYFTKVSTKTVAVATSALRHAFRVGLLGKFAAAVLTPLRGIAMALYLLGLGILEGTRTSRFAVAVALAVGGSLIALWALVPAVPGALPLLGVTLLIAAIILAAVRKKYWVAVVVPLTMAAIVVGYWVYDRLTSDGHWYDRAAEALAVLLFVIAMTLLGVLPLRKRAAP